MNVPQSSNEYEKELGVLGNIKIPCFLETVHQAGFVWHIDSYV